MLDHTSKKVQELSPQNLYSTIPMLPLPSAPKCRAEFHPILKMGNYVVIRGIYRSSLPLTKDAHSRFP